MSLPDKATGNATGSAPADTESVAHDDVESAPIATDTPSQRSRSEERRRSHSEGSFWRRRRTPILAAAATALILGSAAAGTLVAMTKTVTISIDGQQQQISTLAGSVDGALAAAGVTVTEHDALAPAGDQPITDGTTIALNRGRLLSLTVDGATRQVWTTAQTVDQALAELGQDTSDMSLSADRSRPIPLDGMSLTAATLHTVSLSDGATAPVTVTTDLTTVGDLLADRGVTLGAADTVTPAVTSGLADGVTVLITRVATGTVVEQQPIDQPADVSTEDPNLDKGTTAVTVAGAPGVSDVTFQVTTVNGQQTDKVEVSRVTSVEPLATQISVGTKSSLRWEGERVFFDDFEYNVNWDGLARCESTNRPTARNPSGKYTGLFQFDEQTWHSVGGTGKAGDATPEEQLLRAKKLFLARGLQPWECAHAGRM